MTTWLELEDEVKRLRGEVAELTALLDAQSFGATQVNAQLAAADELATTCVEQLAMVLACVEDYRLLRAGNSVEPAKVATQNQGCDYYIGFDATCNATPATGNPPRCREHAK